MSRRSSPRRSPGPLRRGVRAMDRLVVRCRGSSVIARRIATDRWRRRRLIAWLPLPDTMRQSADWDGRQTTEAELGAPDLAADVAEFWLWLDALCRALPTRQRDVIFLRYQHELTDEDIGKVLGLSASGVRTLASRALKGLRKHPELWS